MSTVPVASCAHSSLGSSHCNDLPRPLSTRTASSWSFLDVWGRFSELPCKLHVVGNICIIFGPFSFTKVRPCCQSSSTERMSSEGAKREDREGGPQRRLCLFTLLPERGELRLRFPEWLLLHGASVALCKSAAL